ncbi:hypothetical protein AMECASPLE_023137, partial [Ameca splendens]
DFLMALKVLKLLAPLMTEEQTSVKLGFLLYTVDEEGAVCGCAAPGDACEASVTSSVSELIHPNHVLPALKSFSEQQIPVKQVFTRHGLKRCTVGRKRLL